MTLSRWILLSILFLTVAELAGVSLCSGQENQDIAFADFQFNRSLPGARSLAMGGAFVALADDATAAYTNPSGLTLLTRPEISAEYRSWTAEVTVPYRGRVSSVPTGQGIDDLDSLEFRTFDKNVDDIAFLSAIYASSKRRWTLGVFRHVLARYTASIRSQGVFSDSRIPRFGPYRSSSDLNVRGIGWSGAYAFGRCQAFSSCFRVGLSAIEYKMDLFSRTEVIRDPPPDGKGQATFDEPTFAAATTRGTGEDRVMNAGLLWELSPHWRVAAVYREGPEFSLTERVFAPVRQARLQLPDQIAVGAAFQPTSTATVSIEYDWVEYSTLTEGNGFSVYTIDDVSEWRLGGEYIFFLGSDVKPTKLALMAGIWFDPDHRIQFDPSRESDVLDPGLSDFRLSYFGRSQSTDLHWSLGVGVNFERVQMDLATDVSGRTLTTALSTVLRF